MKLVDVGLRVLRGTSRLIGILSVCVEVSLSKRIFLKKRMKRMDVHVVQKRPCNDFQLFDLH